MGCPGIDICDAVVSFIQSQAVQDQLLPLHDNEPFVVQRKLYFADNADDLDGLTIRVVPGQINNEKNLRMASEYSFVVGVCLRDRVFDPETEVPPLGEFANKLFLLLQRGTFPKPAGTRSLELRGISSDSLFNVSSLENVACYDSLILLEFYYYLDKLEV